MPNKKSKKESSKATLAMVKKEMAEPRLARSVRMDELNVEGHRKGRKATPSRQGSFPTVG